MRRSYQTREQRFSATTLCFWNRAGLAPGFSRRLAASGAAAELLLYDEIGFFGITAKDVVTALAEIGPGPLLVRVNSPGGDVFDGLAIYNALKARAEPVTVQVDGLAASAAALIAMAGAELRMAEQSMLMIHNCWGLCIGDRNDMIENAAVMEKIDGQQAAIFAAKSGKPAAELAKALDAETWMTAAEAKAFGLADLVLTDAPESNDAEDGATAAAAAAAVAEQFRALQSRRRRARLADAEAA